MAQKIAYRIAQLTAIAILAGWAAVVFSAVFMEGGHPPISAYVAMVVIVGSWILNSIGLLCGLGAVWSRNRTTGQILFFVLNAGLLMFSVLILFS